MLMVSKTAAERKAAERARRAQQGLKRLEAWLHPDDYDKTVSYIQKLSRRRAKADQPRSEANVSGPRR